MSTVKKGETIFLPSTITPFKLFTIKFGFHLSHHLGPAAPGCWRIQGLHFRNPQLTTAALSDSCKGRKATCLDSRKFTNLFVLEDHLVIIVIGQFQTIILIFHLFQSSPGLPETLCLPKTCPCFVTPQSVVPLQVCRAPQTPLCDPQSVSHTPHRQKTEPFSQQRLHYTFNPKSPNFGTQMQMKRSSNPFSTRDWTSEIPSGFRTWEKKLELHTEIDICIIPVDMCVLSV